MMPTADSRSIAATPLAEFVAPRVLLIAEGAGRAAGTATIGSVGANVSGPVDLADGAARIGFGSYDAVLVELEEDRGEVLDALLDALDAAAAQRRLRGVVTLPDSLIDIVAARIAHPALILLCAPRLVERSAALGVALAAPAPLLNDVGADGSVRLRQLSEEVGRIARTLASLSATEPSAAARPTADPGASEVDDMPVVQASVIRGAIRARRLRAHYFNEALFADPAWDMLLDLAAARLEGTAVAVSSLCIAAAVPPTTALRWIKTLTDAGLLVRVADPRDRRRVFIELAEPAARAMNGYFAALTKGGLLGT